MNREKIVERTNFTNEEKEDVLKKSGGDMCALWEADLHWLPVFGRSLYSVDKRRGKPQLQSCTIV